MERFNPLLEMALGTPSKLRILVTLGRWQERDLTERELARLCQLSTFGVRHALAELETIALVGKKRIGRAHIWSLNKASYAYQELEPILKNLISVKSPLDSIKVRVLSALPLEHIQRIVLFGSICEKPFYEAADIDICILLRRTAKKSEKESMEILSSELAGVLLTTVRKKMDAFIFTSSEWQRIQQQPLGKSILKGKEIYPHAEI